MSCAAFMLLGGDKFRMSMTKEDKEKGAIMCNFESGLFFIFTPTLILPPQGGGEDALLLTNSIARAILPVVLISRI